MGRASSGKGYSGSMSLGKTSSVRGYSGNVKPSKIKGIDMFKHHDKMMKAMNYKIEQKKIRPYVSGPLEKATYSAIRANPGMKRDLYLSSRLKDPYQGNIINLADYRKRQDSAYKKVNSSAYKKDFTYEAA